MDAKLKGLDKSASYQSVGNWLFLYFKKGGVVNENRSTI